MQQLEQQTQGLTSGESIPQCADSRLTINESGVRLAIVEPVVGICQESDKEQISKEQAQRTAAAAALMNKHLAVVSDTITLSAWIELLTHIAGGGTQASYADKYGLNPGSLSLWLKRLDPERAEAFKQAKSARAESCMDKGLQCLNDADQGEGTLNALVTLAAHRDKHFRIRASIADRTYSEKFTEQVSTAPTIAPPSFHITIMPSTQAPTEITVTQSQCDEDLI